MKDPFDRRTKFRPYVTPDGTFDAFESDRYVGELGQECIVLVDRAGIDYHYDAGELEIARDDQAKRGGG